MLAEESEKAEWNADIIDYDEVKLAFLDLLAGRAMRHEHAESRGKKEEC